MLQFFRRIRRKQLDKGRIGRYLLYALGELTLVVSGILIALYLNGIQDFHADREKELGYLRGFQQDLARNLVELDRVIDKSDSIHRAADSLIRAVASGIDTPGLERLELTLPMITGYTVYLGTDGTLEDLMGSGNLSVIRDDSIRIAMATWKSDLGLLRELESLGKDSFRDLTDHINRNVSLIQWAEADTASAGGALATLLEHPEFPGLVMAHAISMGSLNEAYRNKKPIWQQLQRSLAEEVARLQQ